SAPSRRCELRFPGMPALLPGIPAPRPKAVANAHIEAGNRTELNSRLRYSCNPGYKRKAGTSSLIQCILWNGSEPRWTDPTLQCIRKSGNLGRNTSATQALFLPKDSEMEGKLRSRIRGIPNGSKIILTDSAKRLEFHFPADGVSLLCFPKGDPAHSWETPSMESTTQRGEERDWDWDWSLGFGNRNIPVVGSDLRRLLKPQLSDEGAEITELLFHFGNFMISHRFLIRKNRCQPESQPKFQPLSSFQSVPCAARWIQAAGDDSNTGHIHAGRGENPAAHPTHGSRHRLGQFPRESKPPPGLL
uniref:Sushi domain-containing protein n=1 Tax=Cyanistes caeruleus TaxID=156563 RepID=A0A8C0U5K2_CYACU